MNHHYALILAGGSGTRFWPLSRNNRPKQLLELLGEQTMLRQTIDRLDGLVPREHIYILTNAVQEEEVRRQVPDIPAVNIVAEPARRDTAPAIALGIGLVSAQDPDACMVVLPSDHLIANDEAFRSLIADALAIAAREDALITVGIKPTWPCPSYGYIERGEPVTAEGLSHACYDVRRFREKPDADTAREYLTKGGFSWNAGMFVWSIPAVVRQLEEHCPELAEFVAILSQAPDTAEVISHNFPTLTPVSIDFALMEKADRVLNFEATFDWDDLGSWISVAAYLAKNGTNAHNGPVTLEDARENIVFSSGGDKHIALLGVDSLIVVDTHDALLVADKTRADDIKKVVEKLPPHLL